MILLVLINQTVEYRGAAHAALVREGYRKKPVQILNSIN